MAREAAARTGIAVTIARPSGIYGPGDRRLLKLFRGIARRRFVVLGSGDIFYHLTYIDDLVEGFRLCGEVPAAAGRTYILAGGEVTTLNELMTLIAREAGVSPPTWKLPVWPFWLAGAACEAVCVPLGHRAADLPPSRGFLHEEPRVRHQPRSHARSGTRRRSASAKAFRKPSRGIESVDGCERDSTGSGRPRRTHARRRGTNIRRSIVGQPGWERAAQVRARGHAVAERSRRRWARASQELVSAAPRRLRAQRHLWTERGASSSTQDSHRRQRRDRRQLPDRCEGSSRTRASGSEAASFVGRNTILSCKNGDIELGEGANIGFNCEIFSASRVRIGANALLAAYCYLIGGDHDFSDASRPVARAGTGVDRYHCRRRRVAGRRRKSARWRRDRCQRRHRRRRGRARVGPGPGNRGRRACPHCRARAMASPEAKFAFCRSAITSAGKGPACTASSACLRG